MADMATEPLWQRVEGTLGENADLVANMVREIMLGFQGNKLKKIGSSYNKALTAGPQEGGQDSLFD